MADLHLDNAPNMSHSRERRNLLDNNSFQRSTITRNTLLITFSADLLHFPSGKKWEIVMFGGGRPVWNVLELMGFTAFHKLSSEGGKGRTGEVQSAE